MTNQGRSVAPMTNLRDRFTDGGLTTASAPKIIVLCYDRLDRDIAGAIEAIEARQVERAHELLCHAQDLVHELRCMLDLDAWVHAGALSSIYRYVFDLLTAANVKKSAAEAATARRLLGEIGDAFRQAAASAAAAAGNVPFGVPAPSGDATAPLSLSVLA